MTTSACLRRAAVVATLAGLAAPVWAVEPRTPTALLDQKEFFRPELYISRSSTPVAEAMAELPNRAAWDSFLSSTAAASGSVHAFVDPRSGAATNIMGAFPLIPGTGVGNRITTRELGRRLGRSMAEVDSQVVADAVIRFARTHGALLNIDLSQLGTARASRVTPELWHVSIPQQFAGVPVRHGRLLATISHGNLVLIGVESWGNVAIDAKPRIGAAEALDAGFAYAEGRAFGDVVTREAALEIVPFAPPEYQHGEGFAGPMGAGYGHRLVWTYVFQRPPDLAAWEVMVDAHSGEVIAFQDINQYVDKQATGGVYPLTNTEICPGPTQCGVMQPNWPMPFANTGLPAPDNFTDSAGVFNYTSGTVTSNLNGRYVRITDTCGTTGITSPTGDLAFGGVNGQHDCASPTGGLNTAASRAGFYEVNRIAEQGRGWLPSNTWLQGQITSNMNINQVCNAFYSPAAGTINFYRTGTDINGNLCRNTGEIASVFDHEWGHALDDNDSGGGLSNSSEGYADIAGIYRLNASCVGHGFFQSPLNSCGPTADGTGRNTDEDQTAGVHCDLDCSGVRDADWNMHADHVPDTALNHVCPRCLTSTGPCGRQVHCAAAPVRQMAWDLVKRDLIGAPFNLDTQSALIVGTKLFYQGSGNVGLWYTCTCTTASGGCDAGNGYMQWIAADDDNGNLNDGTPHMTAIHAAYNRHGIACNTPTPQNSGCSGFPGTPATLSGAAGNNSNSLNWTQVSGASRYWVFRTEGHAGCEYGKTLIGEVVGAANTTFTDPSVANGRQYYYNVVAAGTSSACYGPVSNCLTLTPQSTPDFGLSCPAAMTVTVGQSGTGTCTVSSSNGFSAPVTLDCTSLPAGVTCDYAPNPATPPAGGSTGSTLTISVAPGTPLATHTIQARGVSGALTHTQNITLTIGDIPSPDFTIAASPASRTIRRRQSTTFTVTVTPIDGFSDPVALSLSGLPSGAVASFVPATLPGTGSSTLNISTAANVTRGTFTLTITGTSGAKVHSTTVSLTITK